MPYPGSDKSISHSRILFIFYYSPVYIKYFLVVSFLQAFLPKCRVQSFHLPCVEALPISSFLTFIILITFGEGCKFWSPSLHRHLQFPIISSISGPNILLGNLFWNTTSQFSIVTGQVPDPYKATNNNKVLCMYIFVVYSSTRNDKVFCTEW